MTWRMAWPDPARALLLAFLLLVTWDGALRKWGLPAAEQIIFLIKDGVMLAACLYVLLGNRAPAPRLLPAAVRVAMLAYAAWVLVGVLNPALPAVVLGIWGAKSHLLYAGLVLLIPACVTSSDDLLEGAQKLYPWLVIPVSTLALLQVFEPADSALNQQLPDKLDALASFGEANLVRVSGPFSYLSAMAAFVVVSTLLGLGLYLAGCRHWLFLVSLVFSALVLPVTGSRGVIVNFVMGAALLFAAAAVVGGATRKRIVGAVVLIGLLAGVNAVWQAEVWAALHQRFEATRDDESRAVSAFTSAFGHIEHARILGYGTGATNLAAPALVPDVQPFSWLPTGFEIESGRLMLELGAVGWVLSLLLRVAVLLWCLGLLLFGLTRPIRILAMIALPFLAMGLHIGTGFVAAAYAAQSYWFAMALLAVAQHEQALERGARAATAGPWRLPHAESR